MKTGLKVFRFDVVRDTIFGEIVIKGGFPSKRAAENFKAEYEVRVPGNISGELKVIESKYSQSAEIRDKNFIEQRKDISKAWKK